MFDFVPLQYYSTLYYIFLLVIVLFAWISAQRYEINHNKNLKSQEALGLIVLITVVLYMGLRPLSGRYFLDMSTYAQIFENYKSDTSLVFEQDLGFDIFMRLSSKIMSQQMFFLTCSVIYVLPLVFVCKKWFKDYWFYAFLMLISSFSFWGYGVNGIRNGLATTLFLWALSYSEKKVIMFLLLALSCSFHKSILIPTAAFGLTLLNIETKYYFYGWLVAIPLSLAFGGLWENVFSTILADDRSSYLTAGNVNNDDFSSTGFRWDFLIYSATGVFAGYYFIFKKGYEDKLYQQLICTYLTANAFWILIIRANFSNRFAYLSWFMLGIVIIYPLLKHLLVKDQHKVIGIVIISYYSFTFFMNVIIAP